MRYKCIVSYDGTNFHGFQTQLNLRTVQEEIENVLKIIAKKRVIIYYSSRTDALVHAIGQVFHFDLDIEMGGWNMKNALNSRLPKDIYVKSVEKVDDSFHARYSVIKKEYHYCVALKEFDPLKRNYLYYPKNNKFDIDKMERASKIFVGVHDFKSFTKNHLTDNTIREIYSIEFVRSEDILTIKFVGNGFLHNMVRILVAMIFEVGWNNYSENELKTILGEKNRQFAPKIAPPNGLYLFKVFYE